MSLSPPSHTLDLASVRTALGANATHFDLLHITQCGSTNTELLNRAASQATLANFSVLSCDTQTAGRGRRGRVWQSSAHSLCFSLLWRHAADLCLDGLSLAVGLGIARALRQLGASGLALKWPNDIYLLGGKLGGVLIERLPGQRSQALVIGIGLNISRDAALAARIDQSTSCLADSGLTCSREQVLAALLDAQAQVLSQFAGQGFAGLSQEWMRYNAYQDLPVALSAEGLSNEHGICRGVDAAGALLLDTPKGLRSLRAGDLSLRATAENC